MVAVQESRSLWLDVLVKHLRADRRDKKETRRIGILGALGTGDVGDEAMLVSLIAELSDRLPGVAIQVFSKDPDRTYRYVGINSVPTAEDCIRPRESFAVAATLIASRIEQIIMSLPGLSSLPETKRNGWVLRLVYRNLIRQACQVATNRRRRWSAKRYERLNSHLERIAELDALIYLGGGYINSWHVKASCYMYLLSAAVAQALDIPVFGSGMNLGPFNTYDRIHVAPILDKFELIGIRDWKESVHELKRMGIFSENRVYYSNDDAINLIAESSETIESFVANVGPYVALHIHYWRMSGADWSVFATKLAQAVDATIEHSGRSVVMIPMLFGRSRHGGDASALRDIARRCRYSDRMVMAPDNLPPGQLKTLFSRADGALVTRHHAMVFAVTSTVPTVALYFDEYYRMKLVGVAAQFGELCSVMSAEQSDAHKIADALTSALLMDSAGLAKA